MRLLALTLLAALAAAPAHSDSVARRGSDWVRLTLAPCAEPVAGLIRAAGGDPERFRAGAAHIGGQDFTACWAPVSGGAGLVFSDGDGGFVPAGDLKPVPEA